VHSASLEVAHWFSEAFIASAAYAGSFYSRNATLPDPSGLGPAYQSLVAPELAYYATQSISHVVTLAVQNRTLRTKYNALVKRDRGRGGD
jgi:hypothetical protein